MQPTNSRTTLYLNQNLGFEENQIDSRIVGNTLKLTFEGVTDTAQYILTVKSAVSVASNPIERQVLTATGTSLDVDIVLPLSHYNINEDYFISLLEASTSQEVVQAKFIITDRISDGGDTVILQYLSSDYTLSGQPVSTDNKAVDEASRVTDLSGTVTNDEWGGALAVKQYVDTNLESKQFSFTVGTSSKADYLYDGTDISVALNEAITALGSQGGTIFVEGGSYNIVNSITATGKSNITIQGQKKKVTEIIGNSLAVPFVDTTDTVNRFNFSIKDIVLDNTAPITGDTGILFNKAKDGFYMNLTLRNFTNPYVFEDDSLYNVFLNCDTENCINDTTFTATGLPSNSNVFYGCKFLADKNLVNSTLLSHVPVTIQEGNHNVFNGCVFENFTKAIVNSGVGNFFTNNRIESNDITVSSPVYIENQAKSKNNSYSSNYISGNNWVNRATSIIDNGQNYFEETSNFKDQFFKKVRTIVTAGELGTYERQGSGGTIPMITFLDSYANSGTPITVRYQTARFGGTLHDGFFNATEIYNIKANAPAKFNLGVDVGDQKIINVATPTNATDGANKDYVDTALNTKVDVADFYKNQSLNESFGLFGKKPEIYLDVEKEPILSSNTVISNYGVQANADFTIVNGDGSNVLIDDPDYGKLIEMNGTDQYLRSSWQPNFPLGNLPLSCGCWAVFDTLSDQWLVSLANKIVLLQNGANKAEFLVNDLSPVDRVASTTTLTTGTPYFVVGSYDGSDLKIYVNGVLDGTASSAGSWTATGHNLVIGSFNGIGGFVGGKVALPFFNNFALTDSRVKSIYDNTKSKFGL